MNRHEISRNALVGKMVVGALKLPTTTTRDQLDDFLHARMAEIEKAHNKIDAVPLEIVDEIEFVIGIQLALWWWGKSDQERKDLCSRAQEIWKYCQGHLCMSEGGA